MYGRHKVRLMAGKIDIQPSFYGSKNRKFFFFMLRVKAVRIKLLPVKPQPRQAGLIGGEQYFTNG